MSKLGQIFYGRGKDGYGVLGVSPSGRPFSDSVAALCRAVGSPDRPGDVRPFLVSTCERGHVVMVRACRGEDPSGRATLFFHALVAKRDELASAGLDAFVLAERGVFVSSLPDGGVNDMPFPASARSSANPCSADVRFPAFIAAEHPLDAEVRRILGREALSRNWATYSYNPLQGFDLCVHSSYGASPTNGNRYACVNGRLVSASATRPAPSTPQSLPRVKDRSLMLRVSFLLNAVLAAVLVAILMLRGGNGKASQPMQPSPRELERTSHVPQTEPAPEMTREEAFGKWGAEWENAYRQKLRVTFEGMLHNNRHIIDFDDAMLRHVDSYYNDYKTLKAKPQTSQTLSIYETLRAYVSFVEGTVINQRPQSKER